MELNKTILCRSAYFNSRAFTLLLDITKWSILYISLRFYLNLCILLYNSPYKFSYFYGFSHCKYIIVRFIRIRRQTRSDSTNFEHRLWTSARSNNLQMRCQPLRQKCALFLKVPLSYKNKPFHRLLVRGKKCGENASVRIFLLFASYQNGADSIWRIVALCGVGGLIYKV